jgi:hypothetical protein
MINDLAMVYGVAQIRMEKSFVEAYNGWQADLLNSSNYSEIQRQLVSWHVIASFNGHDFRVTAIHHRSM